MLVKLHCIAICWLIPIFSITIANPAYSKQPLALSGEVKNDIPSLAQLQSAKTSATYLLRTPRDKNQSQLSQADIISVTDVKLNTTDKGIELILVTANSSELQVSPKIEGNSYIADIPNAKLQLASRENYRKQKPVAGIALITVANVDTNTLRVTVAGETSAPVVELFDSQAEGLVLGITPAASTAQQSTRTQEQKPEQNQSPIELEVTASPDTYSTPNASVGTRTNTPIRDVPQVINVIPQQVLKDQRVLNVGDALKNAGISQGGLPLFFSDRQTFRSTNIAVVTEVRT